jgi:hypothetical protein
VLEERQARVDDLFVKFTDLTQFCQSVETSTEKGISKINMKFEDMLQEFSKSEEISRVSRRSADDLKEEYCRVVFSVAAERKRNDIFLEAVKRDLEKEMSELTKKVAMVDDHTR